MDTTIQNLQKAGLTEKEAKVYTSLLKLGKGTAYKTALVAGMKIPTVYVVLEELRKKDLVLVIPHTKRKLFTPKDPEELLANIRSSASALENILPDLHALSKERDESKTITFDGYDGIRDALYYKVESMYGKEFLAFYSDSPDAVGAEIIEMYKEWNRVIMNKESRTKVIAPKSKQMLDYAKDFPEKFDNILKLVEKPIFKTDISIEIAEDFVRIISMKDVQATIIDNKRTAGAFQSIFKMIWENVPGKIWKAE